MPSYRCFLRDRRDEIQDVAALRCPDDIAAMHGALDLLAEKNLRRTLYASIEVWHAARLVCTFPHPPASRGAPGDLSEQAKTPHPREG
jgi:hypothetical protein